jgi:hypothetical protein
MADRMAHGVRDLLHTGTVIPAHPLALDRDRRLDRQRQRALTRYYMDAGAGGVAVGVHTTQFQIRDPQVGLLRPVLELAAEAVAESAPGRPFVKVAGVCGPREQALAEARLAAELGYDLALFSITGWGEADEATLLDGVRAVGEVLPVFGFSLQPAVGGRRLSRRFWRDLAEIDSVEAIKIAPFDRYETLKVVEAVCRSSRRDAIALYTGNDDNIVADLLTPFRFTVAGEPVEKRIVGGLLGQWAVWTREAVELLEAIKRSRATGSLPAADLLRLGAALTDANGALFDAAGDFAGSIAGVMEALRRVGLVAGVWCLDPDERLSDGQLAEIDRVWRDYPELRDDDFVAAHLDGWLRDAAVSGAASR